MRKTFLYRANVSKSTAERADAWLETCRILYNLCLEQRILNILSFKAAEAGRTFVRVNPNGTSQKCSRCHIRVPKDLSVRIHACSSCGLVLDRDVNAALNILRAGQALRGAVPENPALL